MSMDKVALIVPLKGFDVAKDRLRQAGTREVTALARELAHQVIVNCAPRHVIVLSESPDITEFALAHSAEAFVTDARSLNDAVQRAYAAVGDRFDQLIIVHGDLSKPEGLGQFSPGDGVTIVTDHHELGTNVLAVPTGHDFRFAYGPDSRRLHQLEAERLGLECQVITGSVWAYDVDEPSDIQQTP